MTVDPKYEYASESSLQHASYMKNSKAIGVLWGVFTICFAIIVVVVFIQPHWLGDTKESRGTGHFGLWQACRMVQDGQDVFCEGKLTDFNSIPAPAFRAATVFVGMSVVIILLCICCMVLFFVFHSSTVFHICGWMQVFCVHRFHRSMERFRCIDDLKKVEFETDSSQNGMEEHLHCNDPENPDGENDAVCMVIGVLTFPAGWDSDVVREVCGPEADDYNPGQCGVRWAYILAIIGVCDCAVLAALAFVLGTRYVKLLPENYITSGSVYKGEVNTAFVADQSNASRKASNLQPVMVATPIGDADHYSDFDHHTLRSVKSFRPDYNSNSSFQL